MARPTREHMLRWSASGGFVVGVGVCFVGIEVVAASGPAGAPAWVGLGPDAAAAQYEDGIDSDADSLSDEFERFTRTDAYDDDSDDDGFSDGAEWVLGSDPLDGDSLPDPRVAVRTYAYESAGTLRLYCGVYPADISLIDTFHFVAGSPQFTNAPEGDPGSGIGIIDLTDALPSIADGICGSTLLGLPLLGFHIDFDLCLLDTSGPLSFAVASRIAGVDAIDQLLVDVVGSMPFVVAGIPADPSGVAAFAAQPLDPIPPPDEEQPEYCAVSFSSGTPIGVATIEYTVTSASCQPDGLLYCLDVDCQALSGQNFQMIDYGFLQAKAGQ